MKTINDEMLNKYLDNELSIEDRNFVSNAIINSPDVKKRYEFLLKSHLLLKNIQPESPSMDFSKLVMQKITRRGIQESQQKRFLFAVLSLFGIVILGFVGYVFYEILNSIQSSNPNAAISIYSNTISDYFSALFGKKNLSIFGSVLSFIMLISAYFLYNYQKHSKNNFSL